MRSGMSKPDPEEYGDYKLYVLRIKNIYRLINPELIALLQKTGLLIIDKDLCGYYVGVTHDTIEHRLQMHKNHETNPFVKKVPSEDIQLYWWKPLGWMKYKEAQIFEWKKNCEIENIIAENLEKQVSTIGIGYVHSWSFGAEDPEITSGYTYRTLCWPDNLWKIIPMWYRLFSEKMKKVDYKKILAMVKIKGE